DRQLHGAGLRDRGLIALDHEGKATLARSGITWYLHLEAVAHRAARWDLHHGTLDSDPRPAAPRPELIVESQTIVRGQHEIGGVQAVAARRGRAIGDLDHLAQGAAGLAADLEARRRDERCESLRVRVRGGESRSQQNGCKKKASHQSSSI